MIMVMAGSAVGLGNIWRFPYLAHENGGGIFLLVYIIMVITFGFTLMITEVAIGRRTRKSSVKAMMNIAKKHKWFCWIMFLPATLMLSYYVVIGGWVINYMLQYIIGTGHALTNPDYFEHFTSGSGGIIESPILWTVVFLVLTAFIVSMGLKRGIEKVSKVLMPILLILMVLIIIYTFTIPEVASNVGEYLYVDFSKFSFSTVVFAAGQMFYSMSLSIGVLVTYGSYTSRDVPLEKTVIHISFVDTLVAMLAGLLIVPTVLALGGGTASSGPGLLFETMPHVFGSMALSGLVGSAFFFLVTIAALTSSIAMMEAMTSSILDHRERNDKTAHKKVCLMAFLIILVMSIPPCLGYGPLDFITMAGMGILESMDFFTNIIVIPIVAITMCYLVTYVLGLDSIVDEVERSGSFKRKRMYIIVMKWVCPVMLTLILVFGIVNTFAPGIL